MKRVFLLAVALALAAEQKPIPGQAGNDDIELTGSVIVEREAVTEALGADLGPGYVIVRMKASPKAEAIRICPDDFTIISRKDGQRSSALAPSQIAGKGALVVKAAPSQGGGVGRSENGPIWGGIGGAPRRMPGSNSGVGNAGGVDGGVNATVDSTSAGREGLLAALKAKSLPDKETKDPVEGLLYFAVEGKVKPKDLGLIYKGPAGKLVIEFANPGSKTK